MLYLPQMLAKFIRMRWERRCGDDVAPRAREAEQRTLEFAGGTKNPPRPSPS
jgi:hypothetical protein